MTTLRGRVASVTPEALKRILRPIFGGRPDRYEAELEFWKSRHALDGGRFHNGSYRRLMLAMAEEDDDGFIAGKIVADFGCGPRGSLAWAGAAAVRIGIDVLADRYADAFSDNLVEHAMLYVKSTERVIPLPSGFVDVMFTLNAIDHVADFPRMCDEIVRVMKPGGDLVASFNLEEPPTVCEPQRLTERAIKASLLDRLRVRSYRITRKGPESDVYAPFFDGTLSYEPGQEGVLWVRAVKPD